MKFKKKVVEERTQRKNVVNRIYSKYNIIDRDRIVYRSRHIRSDRNLNGQEKTSMQIIRHEHISIHSGLRKTNYNR